jgi:hypothetical protein
MQSNRLVSAALVAAMLVASSARAQQTAPDEAQMWRVMVEKLEPAALISVRLKDGARFKGTLLQAGPDAFAIKPQTRIPVAVRQVPYGEVVSIERQKPSMSPGKKVLVGLGIGAGVYMLAAALIVAALGYD